ncbi:sulfatase-like hydrolase/transferase [Halorubrum sp. GN11_10-6_MGM]|uniref:sulfatase-like hydrolase/transferase n=1 Tax=Halorubrum sp. GN11_10-6_MGM TaxID=2518112 RepID=UPI00130EC537|nr:sulfatase-like hydrolase/transferase [Halorubrum sp. GN11_10-6_MGM]
MTRNIALIVLDSVRKDYFDKHARNLNKLSDVSYDDCYAASSWSAPSHASILTGKLPHQHGIHAHNKDMGKLSIEETFLNNLHDHRTVGASTNLYAGAPYNFDLLFDEYKSFNRYGLYPDGINIDEFHDNNPDGIERYLRFLTQSYRQGCLKASIANGSMVKINDVLEHFTLPRFGDYGAKLVMRSSLKLIDQEPFFLFNNFMDAHVPHKPTLSLGSSLTSVPLNWSSEMIDRWDVNNADSSTQYESYLKNFRELYAAFIQYLDRKLAKYISQILDSADEETTVIVTSDHGEELGLDYEDGNLGHVSGVSHSLLHVPLCIINPPDGFKKAEPFTQLDLGELISAFGNGTIEPSARELIPAERIGLGISKDGGPDNYEFWNRLERTTYDGNTRYEWDTPGGNRQYEIVGPSKEKLVDQDTEIPEEMVNCFDVDVESYKQEALSAESELSVEDSTQKRLQDLGYM